MSDEDKIEWDIDNGVPMFTRDWLLGPFILGYKIGEVLYHPDDVKILSNAGGNPPVRRGTGGNRFLEPDATSADLMRSINDQLGDLREWFEHDGDTLDIGKVSIQTLRLGNGRISVTVMGDRKKE